MAKTKEINAKKDKNSKLKIFIITFIIMLVGLLTGAGIKLNIDWNNLTATIDYLEEGETEEEIEPIVIDEYGLGEIQEEIPTVEAVESKMQVTRPEEETECPEGEECGMGALVPYLDTSSPQAFANEVIGRCINVDGYAGSQCWDLADAFWENYAGYPLSTCGTGAAKGTIQDGCWQKNARDKFDMIWDATKIKAGAYIVTKTGTWGHICQAMGDYNNGYVTCLGQNQGGASCPGGGAAANIINLSLKDFAGAFMPKSYIKPEPKPEPKPTPTPKNPDTGIVKKEI